MNEDKENKFIEENVSNEETEINKQHREDYEKLIEESSKNLDGYWDRNNPFVKILLFALFIIIILGVIYYCMAYFT